MDWAKSKTIMIVMLLALNLFMAGFLINRELGDSADNAFYANVTDILNGRGVTLNCKFPKKINDSGLLIYGDGARFAANCAKALDGRGDAEVEMTGRESLRYHNPNPDENLNVSSIPALDAAVRKLMRETGIDLANFKLDYSSENSREYAVGDGYFLQYVLEYDGNLVFDSNVNVTVTRGGGISSIHINYREIKSALGEKHMKVVPAYQVILKNYHNGGDVIASINLGFMGQNTARDNPYVESEEGAVWRVRLIDGSERFFEATYGDEI